MDDSDNEISAIMVRGKIMDGIVWYWAKTPWGFFRISKKLYDKVNDTGISFAETDKVFCTIM